MQCSNCGTYLPAGTPICTVCGNPLTAQATQQNQQGPQPTQSPMNGAQGMQGASTYTTAQKKPMSKKTRNIIIAVVAAVIALIAAYFVMQSLTQSPEDVVDEYVTAIKNGNFDKAASLTKTNSDDAWKESAAMRTSEIGKNLSTGISNVEVSMGSNNTAYVTYKVGSSSSGTEVTVEQTGTTLGIFPKYKISSGLERTAYVYIPKGYTKVKLNGKEIATSKLGRASSSHTTTTTLSSGGYATSTTIPYEMYLYPGEYKFSVTTSNTQYLTVTPASINTAGTNTTTSATIQVAPNDTFTSALQAKIKETVDACIAKTDLSAQGCNFTNPQSSSLSVGNPTSLSRELVSSSISLSEVDMDKGTFRTSYITSRASYSYVSGDYEYTRYITMYRAMSGTFTLSKNSLTVDTGSDSSSASSDGDATQSRATVQGSVKPAATYGKK